MDLAHMIVKQSHDMDMEEKKRKSVIFQIMFHECETPPFQKDILITSKCNMLSLEYKKLKFNAKKTSKDCFRNMKAIVYQIIKDYMAHTDCSILCDEPMTLKIMYKDETVFEDTCFIKGDISELDLTLAPTQHERNLCILTSFIFNYFEMIINADFI